MTRETLLANTFVGVADSLVDDFDVVDLLSLLADRCVEILEVAAAGIMIAGPDGDLRVMASSNEAMRVLELFELQTDEGPCLDCFRTGQPVLNPHDAATARRWPHFSPEAAAAGFHSVHALPLRFRGATIGALNLFCAAAGGLRSDDVEVAQALADVATIAVLQFQASAEARVVNDQLSFALNSRVVIEQAKGIVAERLTLDMDTAFDRLRSYSRRHNTHLTEVAKSVVGGDLLPSDLTPPPRR